MNCAISHPASRVRWWGIGVILLGVCCGCSIATPHLNITRWPVEKKAVYYREPLPYRVVVLPLQDQRPTHERTGQKPDGAFLLLWNRRVGDYYTGDHIFGDHVADQLTSQVTRYLQASNVFAQAVPVPSASSGAGEWDAGRLRELAREHVADFVLTGELKHFFGSQHQQTSIVLLPLYFISTMSWQDNKSLPWGQSTVRFTLHDGKGGDLLWHHQLETNHTLPRETDPMSQAALESFMNLNEELVRELRHLPLASWQAAQPAAEP